MRPTRRTTPRQLPQPAQRLRERCGALLGCRPGLVPRPHRRPGRMVLGLTPRQQPPRPLGAGRGLGMYQRAQPAPNWAHSKLTLKGKFIMSNEPVDDFDGPDAVKVFLRVDSINGLDSVADRLATLDHLVRLLAGLPAGHALVLTPDKASGHVAVNSAMPVADEVTIIELDLDGPGSDGYQPLWAALESALHPPI